MAFDGIEYGSPMLVPAVGYHPKSPYAAETLSAALLSTIYRGRHHGRLVASFAYPYNGQYPYSTRSGGSFASNVASKIGMVYAYVGAEWTHAVAAVVCYWVGAGTLKTRLDVTPAGGSTTTGANTETTVEQSAFDRAVETNPEVIPDIRSFGSEFRTQRAEVALAGLPAVCLFDLYHWLDNDTVRPFSAVIWLEARG
jgi:hypothetical protein